MRVARESVFKAAKLAKCHEFISQLPEGYDSMVGEKGIKLSGGQLENISILQFQFLNSTHWDE